MADQRSSKFTDAIMPGDATMPSVEGECDRVVAMVATTAIRAIATNPVILLCFVTRASYDPAGASIADVDFRTSSSFTENGFLGTADV
jgi:hypothetical protein